MLGRHQRRHRRPDGGDRKGTTTRTADVRRWCGRGLSLIGWLPVCHQVLLLLVYHDMMNERCTLGTLDCDVEVNPAQGSDLQ